MKDPDKYMNHKYLLNVSHLVLQDNIITFSSLLLRGSVSWKDAIKQSKTVRPISCSNKKKNEFHLS